MGGLCLLALIWTSLQPYRPLATRHGGPFHRVAHIGGFGGAALFLCAPRKSRTHEGWVVLGLLVLAVGLETLQYVSEWNVFEWGDVLDDSFGILFFPMLLRWDRFRSLLTGG